MLSVIKEMKGLMKGLSSMQTQSLVLQTDAINNDGIFDSRYTCDIDNSSPELRWDNVPEGTVGFALTAEDLDARQNHLAQWVIYNIPAHIHHLPAGIPPQESLPNGILQGINGLNKLGYAGPCPPFGDQVHRYLFRLYALKHLPKVGRRLTRDELLNVIRTEIIATAEVMGRYQRAIQKAG
jgi:Raf kinase inhibitor-like YbhB/YbcL family protein